MPISAPGRWRNSRFESAVEETREPWHRLPCCGEGVISSRELTPGEVGDRRPLTHVFGILAEFFEAERSIRPREEVDAPVGTRDLMTCQHDPGLVQARRHAESR